MSCGESFQITYLNANTEIVAQWPRNERPMNIQTNENYFKLHSTPCIALTHLQSRYGVVQVEHGEFPSESVLR